MEKLSLENNIKLNMDYYKTILCPVDYSAHSISALKNTLAIAEKFNSDIVVLHVFPLPESIAVTGISEEEIISENNELKDFINTYAPGFDNIKLQVIVGIVGLEIVKAINNFNADLTIMGSHGYSGWKKLLLGSTAEYVLEHSKTPILIVRD